jgi:hypothetical protein
MEPKLPPGYPFYFGLPAAISSPIFDGPKPNDEPSSKRVGMILILARSCADCGSPDWDHNLGRMIPIPPIARLKIIDQPVIGLFLPFPFFKKYNREYLVCSLYN